MKKYIIYSLCFWFFFSSCNDWLDLKPNSQTETDEMFTSYEGFKSALTGCYIKNERQEIVWRVFDDVSFGIFGPVVVCAVPRMM